MCLCKTILSNFIRLPSICLAALKAPCDWVKGCLMSVSYIYIHILVILFWNLMFAFLFLAILEASMMTLQEGQLLLDRIRKVALSSDVQNRHCTTSGCYPIEQLLLQLQDKKYRLEELWLQRLHQLKQHIQLLTIKEEAEKVSCGVYRDCMLGLIVFRLNLN